LYYLDDMIDSDIIKVLRRKFTRLESEMNERGRRRWAASEATQRACFSLPRVQRGSVSERRADENRAEESTDCRMRFGNDVMDQQSRLGSVHHRIIAARHSILKEIVRMQNLRGS
jgi:hypothetical protein